MIRFFDRFRAARGRHKIASQRQKELQIAFAQHGLNFMHLHPDIHGAILKEAIVLSSQDAVSMFISIAADMQNQIGITDDQRAEVTLEIYKDRGRMFADILNEN